MPTWVILPKALQRIRMEKQIAFHAFVEHSGLSDRLLRECERREKSVRLSTVQIIATSLGVQPTDIARVVDDHDEKRARPAARGAESPPAPAPIPMPARTELEALVEAERALGRVEK